MRRYTSKSVRAFRADYLAAENRVHAIVAADAVAVEPLSTPEFPANREINREFRRICPLYEIFKANT